MKLYIIGNGFDLNHGMKTSFKNFKEFLHKKHSKSLGELERLLNGNLWSDFERGLGELEYDVFMAEIGSIYDRSINGVSDDDITYSDEVDFEYYLPNYIDLQKDLNEWLSCINLPPKKYRFDDDSLFLTFNYTNVLEKVYEIDNSRIIHIHGNLSNKDNLQVGFGRINVDKILEEADRDIYTKDFPYELLGYEMLIKYYDEFQKKINANIEKYPILFKKKLFFNEIYILGFSFNEIDMEYLNTIFNNIDLDTNIYISYHEKKDLKSIDKFIKYRKLKNIIIDIMENILEK